MTNFVVLTRSQCAIPAQGSCASCSCRMAKTKGKHDGQKEGKQDKAEKQPAPPKPSKVIDLTLRPLLANITKHPVSFAYDSRYIIARNILQFRLLLHSHSLLSHLSLLISFTSHFLCFSVLPSLFTLICHLFHLVYPHFFTYFIYSSLLCPSMCSSLSP